MKNLDNDASKTDKNILVITYWQFNDPLIQVYTLPYLKILGEFIGEGKIYLVTLDKEKPSPSTYNLGNKIVHISYSYSSFGLRAVLNAAYLLFSLLKYISSKKIDVIHTWCTPAGGIGAILSKLTGKPLVIDSFEPHAEPMIESGTWSESGLAFRILFWLEKFQAKHAKAAIACVSAMRQYSMEKYNSAPSLFYWKPACIDFQNFDLQKKKNKRLVSRYKLEGKVVCVYAGKFGGSYLGVEVFEFIFEAQKLWGDDFRVLLLNNQEDKLIDQYCKESGVSKSIIIKEYVLPSEVPDYMGLGDFGLVPFIPVPSKRYGSPIKTGEYMALGQPVIITKDISDDSSIIDEQKCGYVLNELTKMEYAKACVQIQGLLEDANTTSRIRGIAEELKDFKKVRSVYKEVYSAI